MIVDSSVLVAIVHNEPEAQLADEHSAASRARISAGNWAEAALVRREPLLFKGDDFGHTDVRRA